jgi:hypothetical protein
LSDFKILTPIKAIRANCIECCGGEMKEVRLCEACDCPLWPYRMGKRPLKNTEIANENESQE